MEGLVMFGEAFRGKTVWISGHTGFKGSWLSEWLLTLGANVHGYALAPGTDPALFDQFGLASRMRHQIGDVRNAAAVLASISEAQPDFVFHLAAQPLVRTSYKSPLDTYATNVMGTAHVLDALRVLEKPCTAVMVTTDKCYENREWLHGYREEDPLGGHDPYSSSKAAAEIAIASWRRTFFQKSPVRIASARAGNVIGGGDWALDRIVPDCVRALQSGKPVGIRNPHATRPWQHVLEPLSGYLCLAAGLAEDPGLAGAFNFGPEFSSHRSVREVVEELLKHWPGSYYYQSELSTVHEAGRLFLATEKARHLLRWRPVWDFEETIRRTVEGYRHPVEIIRTQIAEYAAVARDSGIAWAL